MDRKLAEGMSLLEVMIAMAIMAVFSTVFISGIGSNIFSSSEIRSDITIFELAQMKINEIIVTPPPLRETLLTETKDEKEFEEFPGYFYSVLLQKITIPDYASFVETDGSEDIHPDKNSEIKQKIVETVVENMQKLIWQIEITITHRESNRSHTVSSWLYNNKAKLKLGGF